MPAMLMQRVGLHRWVSGRTFWGAPIQLLTGETVSRGILPFGYSELALTALMIDVVKLGMRVVDVGAHLGYEAMLASVLVGSSGKVVCFEPQPEVASWAWRNLRKYQQARLVQAAVGEAEGLANFADAGLARSAFSGATMAANAQSYTARVTTLAAALEVGERPIDFIKCDVEGGEMAILRGARDILIADRPFLVLEAEMPDDNPARPRVREFIEFLSPLGYRPLSFEYDGALKVGPFGSFPVGHANVAFVHTSQNWRST
jgi:FkbM family methyltransferase